MRGVGSWKGEIRRNQTELWLKKGTWVSIYFRIFGLWFFFSYWFLRSALSICPKEYSFSSTFYTTSSYFKILCFFSWPCSKWFSCLSCVHLLQISGSPKTRIILFFFTIDICAIWQLRWWDKTLENKRILMALIFFFTSLDLPSWFLRTSERKHSRRFS